ncbi:hypothetical protein PC118_g12689 [Phytophthora cactorum]|uniref:Uncharacterized protein n=1 Tax=Phytophthora cactorum TaxID=29920 RepID=A0A8T1BZF1_9STRA|nr:hypothetical protein PC111_g9772 [Phytophthora cactorum]KAG2913442.1 hypothetical protein PC115_g12032 [Phytophthora cactorum]KAG2977739.1 hypothetical protein PC118_g12689 [Phytophthora cactorum]
MLYQTTLLTNCLSSQDCDHHAPNLVDVLTQTHQCAVWAQHLLVWLYVEQKLFESLNAAAGAGGHSDESLICVLGFPERREVFQ